MANLQDIIPSFFVGPGGKRLTADQIADREKVAQSLLARASDTRPDAGGWASVLTKGLLGFQAARDRDAAEAATAQNATESQGLIQKSLSGLVSQTPAFPASVAAGGSSMAPAAVGVPSGPTADSIRSGLIQRGLPEHVADGFLMNFQDESGLNPGINEQNPTVPGSRGGFGLYQLTGPRRVAYENYAQQQGVDPSNVDAQLDFLKSELAGPEAAAAKSIFATQNAGDAAAAIARDFLRPAASHLNERVARYTSGSQQAPAAQAINTAAPMQQPSQSVAQALQAYPIQDQARDVDPIVAGADQTLQPTMQQIAPQQTGGINPAVIQALSNPYATPQAQQIASSILNQQLGSQERAAARQAEQETWLARQGYEQQQRQNDPLIQAQTRKAIAEAKYAETNPRGQETFFGNPVAIQNPDGSIAYGQIGNQGSFKPIKLGEGQTFAPPTKQIDTGTEVVTVDQAGNVITRTPKNNREAAAETAGGTVQGKTKAEREISAPQEIQAGQNALEILDQIEKSPYLEGSVGLGSYLSGIRGTPQFEFNNLVSQAKSGAFLTAIQQLRGLGSLSNAEGDAATASITRMNTSDTKEGFLNALRDYRKIVNQGIANAQKRIGQSSGSSDTAQPSAPIRRKFNPQTGRLE